MTWADAIVTGVILLIAAGAIIKIIIDKRKGGRCTGCSDDCSSCPYSR